MMDVKEKAKSAGIELAKSLFIPTYAFRKNLQRLQSAKVEHAKNIVYIKDLYARSRGMSRVEQPTEKQEAVELGFNEMMRSRPVGAPSAADLQRRFLFQKRLAIATGLAFFMMSIYALAHQNWLGILTLLVGMPFFLMASLSAQFRLWQLRNRRLSKAEKGGLGDFMREPGWLSNVLDPEIGKRYKGERA